MLSEVEKYINIKCKAPITAVRKHNSIIFHERDEVHVKKNIDEVLDTSGYELKIEVIK